MDTVVASTSSYKTTETDIPDSIYFGGAAWGGAFYNGVYKGMTEKWGPDFARRTMMHVSGDSAGVMWAIGINLGRSPEEIEEIFRRQTEKAVKGGQLLGRNSLYLMEAVEELLGGDEKAYQKLEGKFTTATTTFPFTYTVHAKWSSNDDLINCVFGTMHVPLLCSRIRTVRGVNVLDGAFGFCGHHLLHGDRTLFIGIKKHHMTCVSM